MTPAARLQAAIELLDEILVAARDAGAAADSIIRNSFKQRRYAGSKDRRAIRDLVYRAIRRFGDRPLTGRAAMVGLAREVPELKLLFDGSSHGPEPIREGEAGAGGGAVPQWLVEQMDPLAGSPTSLLERAPLDIRVNILKARRDEILAELPEATASTHSPVGARLPEGFPIEQHPAWISGRVEIQDEGSQIVALACDAQPDSLVVDLCAGAGGKTLAVAAAMGNMGRLLACDVSRSRLSKLPPRLERAGATRVESRLLDANRERQGLADLVDKADLVLVDAPCSGSGTWRRNPETRWRLTPARLARLLESQAYLLDIALELLRPGGRLTYAVCSVLESEGRGQAALFSQRHPSLRPLEFPFPVGSACGDGRLIVPERDGTDGFFVASWQVPC